MSHPSVRDLQGFSDLPVLQVRPTVTSCAPQSVQATNIASIGLEGWQKATEQLLVWL